MKLGKEAMEALRAEVTGLLAPGDELVAVGAAALSGTVLLAHHEYGKLRKFFSEGFLYNCLNLERDYGTVHVVCPEAEEEQPEGVREISEGRNSKRNRVWRMAEEAGANALLAMGEGGVLSALWKMAEASQVGLLADLRRIPIRQETIEICECFNLNPYYLLSDGALLIGIPSGEGLVQDYRRLGLPAAVIGHTNNGNDRLLYSGGNVRYLDRPARDEIYKMNWYEKTKNPAGKEHEKWQD